MLRLMELDTQYLPVVNVCVQVGFEQCSLAELPQLARSVWTPQPSY